MFVEYRIASRALMAKVIEYTRSGWMDGVKVAFGSRGMTVEAARMIEKSGETWCVCR